VSITLKSSYSKCGGPCGQFEAMYAGRHSERRPERYCGVLCCGVLCCGVLCCGVVCCGVLWCGVVWCGVVCCGVVWCGVLWCPGLCCAGMCCVLALALHWWVLLLFFSRVAGSYYLLTVSRT
jgi:hypothetical protein